MTEIKIKPLSVNEIFQGRRFRTPKYDVYERSCLLLLPKIVIPLGRLKLSLEFGISNSGADADNMAKPIIDILQKKFLFNDNNIWELNIKKFKVDKGEEYIRFKFDSM